MLRKETNAWYKPGKSRETSTSYVVFSVEKSKWDIQITETEINFIGINICGCFTHASTE